MVSTTFWVVFIAFVLLMLAIDLGLFHSDPHAVTMREAAIWTAVWIVLGVSFFGLVYYWFGPTRGLEYITGYLIEKSLSMDNIFVFVAIFSYFSVPDKYQHRVLFWGILGALIFRGILIGVGAALIHRFEWVVYIFGAFLVFTGIKLYFQEDEGVHPEDNPLVNFVRRFIPVTDDYEGQRFLVNRDGVWMMTPLLVVLLIIETTDIMFALDSIPAIFAITDFPFIVFTSNVFAILGLRAMYFLLAAVIDELIYLRPALSIILSYVGVKMLIHEFYEIPIAVSLGVVFGILAIATVASLMVREEAKEVS